MTIASTLSVLTHPHRVAWAVAIAAVLALLGTVAPITSIAQAAAVPSATAMHQSEPIDSVGRVADPNADLDVDIETSDATGEGAVTVRKWICPPGTVPGKSIKVYFELCDPAFIRAFEFALTSGDGTEAKKTESGTVAWAGVPTGQIRILERPLQGFGQPFVYCQVEETSSASISSTPQLMPSGGGTVVIDNDLPDFEYVCYWFNVEKS